MFRLRSKNEIQ